MRVIALFGPTAVGKTAIAIALAERLRRAGENPVAVSADALQVYAGLETLTGAPTAREQERLEHRLVSILAVSETCSAGRYAQLAHAEIDALLATGRRPIVVGGTGLYLRAALSSLDLRPPAPAQVRERLLGELRERGLPALHARLLDHAPWLASRVDANDAQRVVRGLELLEIEALRPPESAGALWSDETRHPTLLVGLTMDRDALYARIAQRTDEMIARGAREEVARAHAAGASGTARKALGFSELLDGDIEAMKRRTRNYAKRQLTWMRRMTGDSAIDITGRDPGAVAAEILDSAAG